jgi:hypothetical protein
MSGLHDGTIQVLSTASQFRKKMFAALAAASCRSTVIFGKRVEDIQYFMDQVLLPARELAIAPGLDPPTVRLRASVRTRAHLIGRMWFVCPHHSVVQVLATFPSRTVLRIVLSGEYVQSGDCRA